MNREHPAPDPHFDDEPDAPLAEAVAAVRDEPLDADRLHAAADRVWTRLREAAPDAAAAAGPAAAAIEGCAGYRLLLPGYLAGALSGPRTLLLEDHLRECVACRHALARERTGEAAAPAATPPARRRAGSAAAARRWLPLAAVLAVALGLVGLLAARFFAPVAGGPAVVAAVDGALLRIGTGSGAPPAAEADRLLAAGAAVAPGEVVRTARGSRAVVRLADGSRIELAERTQISFAARRAGTTVRLDRGRIIVEAADQRSHHLYVSTDDCRVAVTGTVFAVGHGVKGSRVSVIEGEVRVAASGGERVLRPGQQATTRALAAVPVADDIAWSGDVDRYTEMLHELAGLRRALRERVAAPGLRGAGRLLDAPPAGTFVYAALPNLSGQLAESYQVLRERLAESPLLAEWWHQRIAAAGAEPSLDELIGRLRDFGGYLGDEVVVTLQRSAAGAAGAEHGPLVLAEAVRPGLRAFLDQEVARINAEAGKTVMAVVDDPEAEAGAPGDALLLWTGDGLFAAAADPAVLAAGVAAARGRAPSFAGSDLHAQVAQAYADGVEWLFAGDLGDLLAGAGGEERAQLERLGVADVRYLVVEHRGEGERAVTTAQAITGEARRGVLSWLAAPGPMGSLEFISSEASVAAAFVVSSPVAMVDDVARFAAADRAAGGGEPGGDGDGELAEFEAATGIDLRDDLAAALGGEVAFALDGPLVPEPAWKLIVEVYDPARLQATIERAVARLDEEARRRGEEGGVVLESEEAGGRTYYRVRFRDREVDYVYADGYLVAAPDRSLLDRALAQRAAGASLPASAGFRGLLPSDGQAGFSALVYQHVGPLLAPLAGELGRLGAGAPGGPAGPSGRTLTDEQTRALSELAGESGPTLAYAYGEADRIRFASTGPGGPFAFGPDLVGFGVLMEMGRVLDHPAPAPR